jgi:hypothetical protein
MSHALHVRRATPAKLLLLLMMMMMMLLLLMMMMMMLCLNFPGCLSFIWSSCLHVSGTRYWLKEGIGREGMEN